MKTKKGLIQPQQCSQVATEKIEKRRRERSGKKYKKEERRRRGTEEAKRKLTFAAFEEKVPSLQQANAEQFY